MSQRGKMAASVVCLFVFVRSLCGVKSGGHWSESPSHWLFLYVKTIQCGPAEIPRKYISHLGECPLEGLAPVSEGYRDALVYPRLASMPSLEIIHPSAPPTLSASWLEPHEYHPYCWVFVLFFFYPCKCRKLPFVGQRLMSATKQNF